MCSTLVCSYQKGGVSAALVSPAKLMRCIHCCLVNYCFICPISCDNNAYSADFPSGMGTNAPKEIVQSVHHTQKN